MENKKRILVVEQNAQSIPEAARILKEEYEVETITADETEPLHHINNMSFDFILMERSLLEEQLKRITQLQKDIIITMANLIEGRDGTTGEHIKRASTYVELLVKKLLERGLYEDVLTPRFVNYLIQAAPLHDIGKITVPDRILQKPTSLTIDEFKQMQNHAAAGGGLLEESVRTIVDGEFLRIAINIASCHHERWDGSGYPYGLAGDKIPLEARIMALADVFDALVSKRQYKRAVSVDRALEIMRQERGVQFEPLLMDVFSDARDELAAIVTRIMENEK